MPCNNSWEEMAVAFNRAHSPFQFCYACLYACKTISFSDAYFVCVNPCAVWFTGNCFKKKEPFIRLNRRLSFFN